MRIQICSCRESTTKPAKWLHMLCVSKMIAFFIFSEFSVSKNNKNKQKSAAAYISWPIGYQ